MKRLAKKKLGIWVNESPGPKTQKEKVCGGGLRKNATFQNRKKKNGMDEKHQKGVGKLKGDSGAAHKKKISVETKHSEKGRSRMGWGGW